MKWPPPSRILLVFFVALYWPLVSAGIGRFGVSAEGFSSTRAFFNLRRSLKIGAEKQGAQFFSSVSAPSSSPLISPPEGSPSPSPFSSRPNLHSPPSHHHPSVAPPNLVRPWPSTGKAEHGRSVETPHRSWHKHSQATYGLVAAGITTFFIISVAAAFYCRAKRGGTVKPWVTGLSGQLQKAFVTGVPALKRSELETASEDFSNIIGSTSSCMLYKGTLSSGVEIALASSLVASAKDWSRECESEYRKKITNLSKVNHKNFMNLLGYCEEGHPFTRAMVFEYAPNGTLFEYLHGNTFPFSCIAGVPIEASMFDIVFTAAVREAEKLDWMTRLRISMGVAYCLEHMHQLKPPVVLRNFDSTTIYLTDDFAAKVSDLEFSSDATGPNPTNDDLENTVHKYGIVLLEILTGRIPYSVEDGPLEQWASRYFNGEMLLAQLIDPSIGFFSEEAARALCEIVRSCIDPDPKRRPPMAEVAARMREITMLAPDRATPKVSPLWWAELEIMSSDS